jgi:hypothetical protein
VNFAEWWVAAGHSLSFEVRPVQGTKFGRSLQRKFAREIFDDLREDLVEDREFVIRCSMGARSLFAEITDPRSPDLSDCRKEDGIYWD